jgi:class 3 adenylate cyclase
MIQSIFGFCDIRNFTDTTECLQEEVMLFVNKIAHILHGVMSQYNGAANKNIGDAFLLTWKLKEGSTVEDLSALADQALLCFIRTMIELKKRNDFVCNFSPGAYQRLYKRMPGYTVKMGFGLHLGWAVEGALGSFRKIDATYISPHVNMSEFLESSSKTYGIPLLMSEAFWICLSPVPKQDARLCDRVQPGPHDAPLSLYTYDVDLKLVGQGGKFGMGRSSHQRGGSGPGPAPGRGGHILRNFSRKMVFEERKGGEDVGKERVPEIQVPAYYQEIWERDSELKAIRAPFSRSYIAAWHEAMELYLSGDWSSCHEALLDLQNSPMAAKIEDGPLMWLLDLLERHQLEAPAGWEGYRDVS